MAYGWERPADAEIQSIVASILSKHDRASILEIGAGSTWGTEQRNYGVPGLARIIKHALPTQARVAVCDRAQGCEMFFVDRDGALVRVHYSDDTPPKGLSTSLSRPNGTIIPLAPLFIEASAQRDPDFADWLRWHERAHNVTFSNGGAPLFLRPKLDPEIEAKLFGVRVVPGSIDYLNLMECLVRAGERERYDLIFGRHLLPQYFTSEIKRLEETMPKVLAACAHHAYVQFDHCLIGSGQYADMVFEHHEYSV